MYGKIDINTIEIDPTAIITIIHLWCLCINLIKCHPELGSGSINY